METFDSIKKYGFCRERDNFDLKNNNKYIFLDDFIKCFFKKHLNFDHLIISGHEFAFYIFYESLRKKEGPFVDVIISIIEKEVEELKIEFSHLLAEIIYPNDLEEYEIFLENLIEDSSENLIEKAQDVDILVKKIIEYACSFSMSLYEISDFLCNYDVKTALRPIKGGAMEVVETGFWHTEYYENLFKFCAFNPLSPYCENPFLENGESKWIFLERDSLNTALEQYNSSQNNKTTSTSRGRKPRFPEITNFIFTLMDEKGEFSNDDPKWNCQARLVDEIITHCNIMGDTESFPRSTAKKYAQKALEAWRKKDKK